MPRFKAIGRLIPEKKIFKGYLPYSAILFMWPRPLHEQTSVPQPRAGSICNLVSIGPAVSEEMFKNVDDADDTDADADAGRRTTAYPISSSGVFGFGGLKWYRRCPERVIITVYKPQCKEKQSNQLPLSQQGDHNARHDPLYTTIR